MYRGATPTVTLTLPESIDLTGCTVYVTLSDENYRQVLSKEFEGVSGNVITFLLTQSESLKLPSTVLVQVNMLFQNGSRACTKIASFDTHKNLINEVLL